MRLDRILAAAGAALMVAGSAAWASAPAGASFLPAGQQPTAASSGRAAGPSPRRSTRATASSGSGPSTRRPSRAPAAAARAPRGARVTPPSSPASTPSHCPNGNNDDQPFYSPNGNKVVYRSDCNGTNHAIYEVPAGPGLQVGTPLTTDGAEDSVALVRARQPHGDLREPARPPAALEDRRRRTSRAGASARVRRPERRLVEPGLRPDRTRPRSCSSRARVPTTRSCCSTRRPAR